MSKSLVGGGLVELHDSYLPITKILKKIYACNLQCRLELTFPYFFIKNSVKLHVSFVSLAKNRSFPILCVYLEYV